MAPAVLNVIAALIPRGFRTAIKDVLGLSAIEARITQLASQVARLDVGMEMQAQLLAEAREARASVTSLMEVNRSLEAQIYNLRSLYEYAVMRPIDLVKHEGHLYFWYTRDFSYTFMPERSREFLKNYVLTSNDLGPKEAFAFTLDDFWERAYQDLPPNEMWSKYLVFAYFWKYGIDFIVLDVGAILAGQQSRRLHSSSGSAVKMRSSHLNLASWLTSFRQTCG